MNISEKANKRIQLLLLAAVVFCILAQLLLFAYLNFRGLSRYCNSDVFADMQVAKRMWEQKTFFPDGWTFGNQFYIVATPALAALAYGVCGNINLAMAVATEVMMALVILSFLWLLRAVTKDFLTALAGCLLLLMCVIAPYGVYSMNSLLFFTQASFYSCYLITMFVVFGDYARAYLSDKPRVAAWMVSLLLSFATGMHSFRQTAVMILPIAAYELFYGLRNLLQRRTFWQKRDVSRIIRVASYAVVNLSGVATVKLMNVPSSPIYGNTQMSAVENFGDKLAAVVGAAEEITSLDYLLAGDYSRFLAIVIAVPIVLAVAAALLWIARIKRQEDALELYWILCLIGIAGVFLSSILMDITLRGIYVFMWFPLVAFSGLMVLRKIPSIPGYAAVAAVCLLSLGSLLYCYGPYVSEVSEAEETDAQRMSQWAVSQGYAFVYGDYWGTAPQIAVWSEGKLDAGCWHGSENVFQIEAANTPQDIYTDADNERAIYVFTAEDEAQGLQKALERGVALTESAQFGKFHAYTSPIQLMY